ncbi:hypothetical protein [Clostridium disporicum]|uniref:hypothetical protein n=1 Tax=Clostridium disporicum TaxID=84024 RepID=UPI0034A493D2
MAFCVLLFSFGLIIKGLLYFLVASTSVKSKLSNLSILKTNDKGVYYTSNKYAFTAYSVIGIIVFLFTLIMFICQNEFLTQYYLFYVAGILMMDCITNIIVHIKIKISEYDKAVLEKEKENE